MILVTIPYYKSAETLKKTVDSILHQSYKHYEILIINDGDEVTPREVLGFDHPKIKYFDMKKNRGTYFCNMVAVEANPHAFYIPHDSDDESKFNRLFYLVQKQVDTDADVVYSYQEVITSRGRTIRENYPLMKFRPEKQLKHIAHWAMLYRTSVLKGLIIPDFRVGYDTLITNIVRMNNKVELVPRILYTRNIRRNSLTMSRDTGFMSPYRRQVVKDLIRLYEQLWRNPSKAREIVLKNTNARTLKEVHQEAARLRKLWS